MGGAVFLGLTKPVIKAHGNSKAYGFSVCISQAMNAVRGGLTEKIEALLEKNAATAAIGATESAAEDKEA